MSAFLDALHEEGTINDIVTWINKLGIELAELRGAALPQPYVIDPEKTRIEILNELTELHAKVRDARRAGLTPKPAVMWVSGDGTVRQAYYGSGEQPWDVIKRNGWAHHFAAGNVLKYLRREKENRAKDDDKARWYYFALLALRGWGNYNPMEVDATIRQLERDLTVSEKERLLMAAKP